MTEERRIAEILRKFPRDGFLRNLVAFGNRAHARTREEPGVFGKSGLPNPPGPLLPTIHG